VAGSNIECTAMPNRSPYVRFKRNQTQGVIKIVVTDAQPLSPKSVAGPPPFTIAVASLFICCTPHQEAALGLDPILDPNTPTLTETQRHRLVCQNSKSADKIKTNDTSQHTM